MEMSMCQNDQNDILRAEIKVYWVKIIYYENNFTKFSTKMNLHFF